jgi:ParB-like chromosome segregation protein Spo0J
MEPVDIDTLLARSPVDPEGHLDRRKVTRLAQVLDELPPVVVFQTDEGLLLVDGYHRVAAAKARGRSTIAAEVKTGSRSDAARYAVARAVEAGAGEEEAWAAIRRRGRAGPGGERGASDG